MSEVKGNMSDNSLASQVKKLSNEDLIALGLIVDTELENRKQKENKTNDEYDAIIYVDGSCDRNTKRYAYGVKIEDSEGTHYFKKAFGPDEMSSMNNVAGEIAGASAAMSYSLEHNFEKIKLCYDYKGIERWCKPGYQQDGKGGIALYKRDENNKLTIPSDDGTGEPIWENRWQSNKVGTKAFADLYDRSKESLEIDFVWTPGHTGIDGNEICDSLAKSALGIKDSKYKTFANEIDSAKPYVSNSERLISNVMSKGAVFDDYDDSKSIDDELPWG